MEVSASSSAGPSSLSPAFELSLGARVALEAAKSSIEQAVNIIHEELTTLQKQHTLLQSQHLVLQQQHEQLQNEYKSQVDSWKEFKTWWKKTTERKKAASSTQQTPSKLGMSNNYPSSPLVTPSTTTALEGRSRVGLSTSEFALLERIGLDCSAFDSPASTRKERDPVARVRGGEDKDFYRPSRMSSPIEPRRIQSDGAGYSDRKTHLSVKKRRSSPGADEYSSPSRRRILGDVGNNTQSDASDEQDEFLTIEKKTVRSGEVKGSSIQRKGRGRYSAGRLEGGEHSKTINQEFQIDPEKNGNVSFLHKSVVRDRAQRKQMHAHDCECCSEYYKAVGEPPLRRYQDPRSIGADQSAQDEEIGISGEEDVEEEENRERKRQAHRQQISRHRGYGPPAATPPGYWNTGFPSTQERDEINRLAREEHAKKRNQIAQDPRYVRRS